MQHFILKLILLFSAVLSVNSVLAVPLSSVINSGIHQVEYRQTPSYKSLVTLSAVKPNFQLTHNNTYNKQLVLSVFTPTYYSFNSPLAKLITSRIKQHYQQQTIAMLTFSSEPKNRYFQQVPHQTEKKTPLYKNLLN